MNYLLFIIYLIVVSWALTRSAFLRKAGMPAGVIVGLFVLKVLVGCFNVWLSYKLSPIPDVEMYHAESVKEYHLLFNEPLQYFTNIFHSGYATGYDTMLKPGTSYWNDLTSNLIIKFLSVCNIFSGGNFYINLIFFNALCFFGITGLYRVFVQVFKHRWIPLITCFLLPTVLFYSSVTHKDGFILAAIGTIFYNMYRLLEDGSKLVLRIGIIVALLFLMLLLRNYSALAMVPVLLFWYLIAHKKITIGKAVLGVYGMGLVLFFGVGYIFPTLNFPLFIAQKQEAFLGLPKPNTYIELQTLEPHFISFVMNLPQALAHVFLRPWWGDLQKSIYLLPHIVEWTIYILALVVYLAFRIKSISKPALQFIWVGLLFSLPILCIIGYTVPVLGAIVRYRTIVLPFLLTPVFCLTNWSLISSKFNIIKK
ncbi:MAG: hypothetical protein ACOYKE_05680 [Ferruginibacter sp.]